jgi:hypothetical protein
MKKSKPSCLKTARCPKGLLCFAVLLCFAATAVSADSSCPPEGYTTESLLALKEFEFKVEDDARRNQLAVALTSCLSDPDSRLRDGVAYEGLTTWLRAEQLSSETLQRLFEITSETLRQPPDPEGFQRPFAALALSEVVRTDRITPWLTPEQRQAAVDTAAQYLSAVKDYRGFSEPDGWRHGVAHGSDLILQLVLNELIEAGQIQHMMAAVADQVAPPGTHFYVYGEPARLARPAFYAYRRGVMGEAEWTEWFGQISRPQPLENWGESFLSQAGLARRHNTLAFLMAMYINADASDDEQGESLSTLVMNALTQVMGG